jgi:hypothetical protein
MKALCSSVVNNSQRLTYSPVIMFFCSFSESFELQYAGLPCTVDARGGVLVGREACTWLALVGIAGRVGRGACVWLALGTPPEACGGPVKMGKLAGV